MAARVGLLVVVTTLLLACGDDAGPADGSEGSMGTVTDPSEAEGSTADPTVATGDGPTVDPDGTSGGPVDGTPGCGLALPTGVATVGVQVGSDDRQYLISVPEGYDPGVPTPLVFAFHGRGGTSELARLYFQVEEASAGEAIFVYPQGLPVASMGGQTGWDLGPAGIDVDFFDAMLEQLSEGACIDTARVLVTGHSFGGYMSNALGCFRASVLRAIAPVAGGPPFAGCEQGQVAGWMAHGTLDEVVPFSQGEAARDALLIRNGCSDASAPVDPDPCVGYEGCDEGMPVVWCAHDETDLQGHTWPSFAGPAIWAFFASLPPAG